MEDGGRDGVSRFSVCIGCVLFEYDVMPANGLSMVVLGGDGESVFSVLVEDDEMCGRGEGAEET